MVKFHTSIEKINKEFTEAGIKDTKNNDVGEYKAAAANGNERVLEKLAAFVEFASARKAAGLETVDTDILHHNIASLEKMTKEYQWITTKTNEAQAATRKAQEAANKQQSQQGEQMSPRRNAAFAALRSACASAGLPESNASETLNESLSDEQVERKARLVAARGRSTVGNFNNKEAAAARKDNLDEWIRRGLK